jgi:hypothetical protein
MVGRMDLYQGSTSASCNSFWPSIGFEVELQRRLFLLEQGIAQVREDGLIPRTCYVVSQQLFDLNRFEVRMRCGSSLSRSATSMLDSRHLQSGTLNVSSGRRSRFSSASRA